MSQPVEQRYNDPALQRAWELALAVERDAAENPERTAERRRRVVRWVKRYDKVS